MRSPSVQFAAAFLTLAGVTLACFHPLTRHPTDVLVGPQRGGENDLTGYFIPIHSFPRQCMADFGQLPFWNPYRSCGVPHLGNPQSALFYPPNWLCWWWDPAHVLSWSLVAHHLFAGIGCYLLCRRYGFGWLASVTSGSIFLAAPYLIAQTGEGHYAQICVVAWMPWTILAYEGLRTGSRRAIAGLAATLAMSFFAGHHQEVYYLILILTAWVIADAVARWRASGRCESGKHLLAWVVTGLVTLALVAVDLVPIAVYSGQTARAEGLSALEAGKISMSVPNLLQLLNAFALGGPDSYGGADKFFWESLCSFGIPPLALAIFGVATAWRTAPVPRMACTCLVALAFAFGSHGPVFRILYAIVPGMTMFRVPSRAMFFCSLAVAVLAGAGLQSLLDAARDWSDRRRLVARRLLIGVAIPCVLAIFFCQLTPSLVAQIAGQSDRDDGSVESDGVELQTAQNARDAILRRAVERSVAKRSNYAWLLGSLAIVYLGVWRGRFARTAVVGLGVLSVVQLVGHASKLLIAPSDPEFGVNRSAARLIQRQPGIFRVLCTQDFVPDFLAQLHRIAKVQAYDPLPLSRHTVYFSALTDKPDPTSVLVGGSSPDLTRLREHLLDLANVRLIAMPVSQSSNPPHDFRWQEIEWDIADRSNVTRGGIATTIDETIFENSDALPRAFVVGQAKLQPQGGDAIAALTELRPRDEVLIDTEYVAPGPRAEFAEAPIVEYTPNRVVIETDLAAPGYLVLSDTWYPGWTATDNEQPIPVVPANVAFRAVPLSAGKHRIVFQFRPPGLWIGAVVSVFALIGLIAMSISAPSRGNRCSHPPVQPQTPA